MDRKLAEEWKREHEKGCYEPGSTKPKTDNVCSICYNFNGLDEIKRYTSGLLVKRGTLSQEELHLMALCQMCEVCRNPATKEEERKNIYGHATDIFKSLAVFL